MPTTRPQSDDIARLAYIITRMHQGPQGRARKIMGEWAPLIDRARIGAACGVSAGTVEAWESGDALPTTGQALAWLTYIYSHADTAMHGPPTMNGKQPPQFTPAGQEAAK